MRPEFFDVVLDLALDYRLALRLPSADVEQTAGFPFRRLAAEEGVIVPDRVTNVSSETLVDLIAALEPGVTELVLRPAIDTPELRTVAEDAGTRCEHLTAVCSSEVADTLRARGAQTVAWRDLRAAQRAAVS